MNASVIWSNSLHPNSSWRHQCQVIGLKTRILVTIVDGFSTNDVNMILLKWACKCKIYLASLFLYILIRSTQKSAWRENVHYVSLIIFYHPVHDSTRNSSPLNSDTRGFAIWAAAGFVNLRAQCAEKLNLAGNCIHIWCINIQEFCYWIGSHIILLTYPRLVSQRWAVQCNKSLYAIDQSQSPRQGRMIHFLSGVPNIRTTTRPTHLEYPLSPCVIDGGRVQSFKCVTF